jgi:hypothetical protein
MSGRPNTPALTAAQVLDSPAGVDVNVAVEIDEATDGLLVGRFIDPDEQDPFGRYHRTNVAIKIHWDDATDVVMGSRTDVVAGAPVWVTGVIRDDDAIDARRLALLGNGADVTG